MRAAVKTAQTVLRATDPGLAVDGVWGRLTDSAYTTSDDVTKVAVASSVQQFGVTVDELRPRRTSRPAALGGKFEYVSRRARELGLKGESLVNFLATVGAETDFRNIAESGAYKSVSRMREAFGSNPNVRNASDVVLAGLIAAGSPALLSFVYAMRNGNSGPRDGWMYRGRGFIQLSWRANYASAGKDLGVDLVGDPDAILKSDDLAMRVAVWYWNTRVVAKGGAEDLRTATRLVRGSDNETELRKRERIAKLVALA